MSFQPREFGKLYYGWELTHLPPGEWRDLVQQLHLTTDPIEQLAAAKRILVHGPLKAWCIVFTLTRYYSTLERWGLSNPFLPLVGQVRRRALQVIKRGRISTELEAMSALMGLSFVPRYRDLETITSTMDAHRHDVDVYGEGLSLLQHIAAKGWGRSAPELLAFVQQELQRADLDQQHLQGLFAILSAQGGTEAESILWHYANTASFAQGGLQAMITLLHQTPTEALPLALTRKKTLLRELKDSGLDANKVEYLGRSFQNAWERAQSHQEDERDGEEWLRQLRAIIASAQAPAQSESSDAENEPQKSNGPWDEKAAIQLIAEHLGTHGLALDRRLLQMCLDHSLATPQSWVLLHEKVAACLDHLPTLAAPLLLKMTEERERSPEVKRIEALFALGLTDNPDLVEALALPLFFHLGRPIDWVVRMFDSPFVEVRTQALELLGYIPNPPIDFAKTMQQVFDQEEDEKLRADLLAFLQRLHRWQHPRKSSKERAD